MITCVFKDDGRVLAVFAKRARGLLARHVVTCRVKDASDLKTFSAEGYRLDDEQSEEDVLVFTRSKRERPAPPPPVSEPTGRGKRKSATATNPKDDGEPSGTGGGVKKARSKAKPIAAPTTRRATKSSRRKG